MRTITTISANIFTRHLIIHSQAYLIKLDQIKYVILFHLLKYCRHCSVLINTDFCITVQVKSILIYRYSIATLMKFQLFSILSLYE